MCTLEGEMTRSCFVAVLMLFSIPAFGQEFTLLGKPKAVKSKAETVKPEPVVVKPEVPLPTLDMISNTEKSVETPKTINFSLTGKEVPGSNPEYFRFDKEDGSTVLLLPSGGVDFGIDGFPYPESLGSKKRLIENFKPKIPTEIEPPSTPEVEEKTKLKLLSYEKAYEKSIISKRPLIVFALNSDEHVELVNGFMDTLNSLGAYKYFHFAVIDGSDSNYDGICKKRRDLQVVVWWHKDKRWQNRIYTNSVGAQELFQLVKDWVVKRKDNVLLDVRIDFVRGRYIQTDCSMP